MQLHVAMRRHLYCKSSSRKQRRHPLLQHLQQQQQKMLWCDLWCIRCSSSCQSEGHLHQAEVPVAAAAAAVAAVQQQQQQLILASPQSLPRRLGLRALFLVHLNELHCSLLLLVPTGKVMMIARTMVV
jgi:hypothetical protein